MKYFVQVSITNVDTLPILKEAFKDEHQDEVLDFQPTSPESPGENPFWPLLGSPNRRGINFFLKDYKLAMKSKGVEKLSAKFVDDDNDEEGIGFLWATISRS